MRQSTLFVGFLLAVSLSCAWTVLRAEDTAAAIVGTWELVGFGDTEHNDKPSVRIRFAFDASGRYDYQVWENEGEDSLKVSGVWTVENNVLRVQPQNAQALKAVREDFRIDWDGRTMLMYPPKEGNHEPIPFRFEKNATY